MSIAIRVENVSKKYTIGHEQPEKYTALRDVITNGVKSIFKSKFTSRNQPAREEFWALNDISFEIKQGDRVGIIGRNGAGKSTLLKVLSRITEPTHGRISIKGRIASLLEVGTGFHPELTGRENIFLNGSILGMSQVEIRRKFDEIVDFAEVEKFLDTPVKRYSSGMYVRLAFAVAAHLEPEILVVDEVLAVGDAQFQKKCLGKMEDVSKRQGRTVLFVSHNMAVVANLCNRCIVMNHGRKLALADTHAAIALYQNLYKQSSTIAKSSFNSVTLEAAYFINHESERILSLQMGGNYKLVLQFSAFEYIKSACLWIKIFNQHEIQVSSIASIEEGMAAFDIDREVEFSIDLTRIALFPGEYSASVYIYSSNGPEKYFEAEKAFTFEVCPALLKNAAKPYRPDHGIFRISDTIAINEPANSTYKQ
jgi:lipopolysaccharide transport system ATP-binding protein